MPAKIQEPKLMTMKDAVKKYVTNGCSLAIANFLAAGPYATVHEIMRQQIKDLTLYTTSTICEQDMLVAGGCVKRIATAYSHRFSVSRRGTAIERAIRKKEIEYEEFSNYALSQMFQAGAMGLDFMPMLPGIAVTDIFKKRTWMGENKMKLINSPFSGKKYVAVPAINPDVTIIHAQRADIYGNVQYWGTMSAVRDTALAAKHIIVSVEEIVDHSVIQMSPHNTIIPGFRVDALVHCPWGAHPLDCVGYYALDYGYLAQFFLEQMSSIGLRKFLKKWVYDCPDRETYVELLVEEYGQDSLTRLKAKFLPGAPVNYGGPLMNMWSEQQGSFSPWLNMSKTDFTNWMKTTLNMYPIDPNNIPADCQPVPKKPKPGSPAAQPVNKPNVSSNASPNPSSSPNPNPNPGSSGNPEKK